MLENFRKNKQIRLIISTALFRSAKTALYLFLNILIWKESNDIRTLFIFNLILSITHTIFFITFGRLLKNGYRKLGLGIGTIGSSLIFLALFLFKENLIDYIYLFSISLGAVSGIYRVTFGINMFDITTFKNRGNFEGIKRSIEIILKIIIPIIVGGLISLDLLGLGYEMGFLFGAILFIFSYIIGNIKIDIEGKGKFNLIDAGKKFYKNKDIFTFLVSYLLIGLTFNTILLDFILPLLVFDQVQIEYKMGIIVSIFSIISALGAYLYGKFISYKDYGKTIIISGILYGLSLITLLLFPRFVPFITAFLAFLYVFYNISIKIIGLNVLHKLEDYKEIKSEYLIIREIFLMTGRTLVYVFLIFIGSIGVENLRYLFYLMIIIVFIVSIILSKIKLEENRKI